MRVLVTGGAGYIGSVLSEALLRAGHAVIVYDSLFRGHRDAVPEGARLVEGDVLETARLIDCLRGEQIDAVIHAAGLIAVGESVQSPALYYRANVEGGLHLLDAMVEAGVLCLVFSSTAAVYGEPEQGPLRESHPTRPTSPYGETKLAFERALGWYGRAYGLRHVSLRYFNAAGATERCGERHDPETHLIPQLLAVAAGERGEVTIFGSDYATRDGTCVRDYIHVLDLAAAHLLALDALRSGLESRAFNVGYGTGHSVLEVVESVRRVTGHPLPVRAGERRPGDPAYLVAASDAIRAELGWKPAHADLDAIVASAWEWMRRRGAAQSKPGSAHSSSRA